MKSLKHLRQYGIYDLANIVLHKAMLRVCLWREKRRLNGKEYGNLHQVKFCVSNIAVLQRSFAQFLLHDSLKADRILDGEIEIFGKWYEKNGWLVDPISGKCWPRDVFFADTKVRLEGYGDVKFVLEVNKFNHLVTVASAWNATHQFRYIDFIEQELMSWCREVPYERSVANRIIMDLAFRILNLITVSILCFESEKFRCDIYPLIHRILLLSERQIKKFSTPRWFKTGNGANHVIGEMVGYIVGSLWMDFIAGRECNVKGLEKEYRWLYSTLDRLIAPSGVYLEQSANYSRLVCEFLVFLDIFEQTANITSRTRQYLTPLNGYVMALYEVDGTLNFGDNDGASVLNAFKMNICDISPIIEYQAQLSVTSENLDWRRYNADGHFLWKSQDDNDIRLFIRHGNFCNFREGAAAHAHCDLLSILLSVKGMPVFVDRGCYSYNTGKEQRYNDVSTMSHNTIVVNDEEQAKFDGKGYVGYPISEYHFSDIAGNCIFSASVCNNNVMHHRKLYYDKKSLLISDEVRYNGRGDLSIHYVLSDVILPHLREKVVTLNMEDMSKIHVAIHNVDTVECIETTYSPLFANEIASKMIEGTVHFKDTTNVITKITFDEE